MLFSPVGSSQAPAHPGRVHRRAADRGDHRRSGARQGEPELREDLLEEVEAEAAEKRSGDGDELRSRRGSAARGRDPARRRDGHRVDVDAPAPAAARLHARRAADRHARAPRGRSPATRAPSRARCSSRRPTCRACWPRCANARREARRVAVPERSIRALASPAAMPEIGATLREARMRARIDITEIEAADEDPRQVPARARERGVGPAARAHVRQELPAHVRGGPRPRRQHHAAGPLGLRQDDAAAADLRSRRGQ